LAGAFVGLAVGILWWASHVHHEMGRGLGVFLVLAGGIILYAWATPRR
jgi:NhaP-type Na+/H+ and K+/H+ antiporter